MCQLIRYPNGASLAFKYVLPNNGPEQNHVGAGRGQAGDEHELQTDDGQETTPDGRHDKGDQFVQAEDESDLGRV